MADVFASKRGLRRGSRAEGFLPMTMSRRAILLTAAPGPDPTGQGAQGAASGVPVEGHPGLADLVRRAAEAHAALMRGDLATYRGLIALADDFVLMSPFGGEPTRAADMSEDRWAAMQRFFRNGRDSALRLVQAWGNAEIMVLAVIERTHAEVGGLPAQDWMLRVTLVFRREGGGWSLAHRHADPLAGGVTLEAAAAMARTP